MGVVTTRLARPGDVEALAQLHVSTWRETYSALVPESFFSDQVLEERRTLWTRALADTEADNTIVVTEIGGHVVGFAMAGAAASSKNPPRDRELYMIYLAKSAHGTGAGQMMLDVVLGSVPAFLWTARENPRARAFYARNGFAPDGTEWTDPRAENLVEIRMVR